jgi:hypothetical protein
MRERQVGRGNETLAHKVLSTKIRRGVGWLGWVIAKRKLGHTSGLSSSRGTQARGLESIGGRSLRGGWGTAVGSRCCCARWRR